MFKFCVIFTLSVLLTNTSLGQRLILERAESSVLVQRDNLVKAKQEALKDSKTKVILQALSRFLNYETMIALEPILLKHFLDNPDIFIESIRIISEGNKSDFSEFNIKIETQIFRSQILSALRKLGIPTLEEKIPFREVYLIFNANNDLRKKRILYKFFQKLQHRLNPYKIKIKVIDTKDNNLPIEAGLTSRIELLTKLKKNFKKDDFFPLLELKLKLFPKTENINKGNLEAEIIFWSQNEIYSNTSKNQNKAKANVFFSTWNVDKNISQILDTLMLKWTTVIQNTLEMNKGIKEKIKLFFLGVTGPIQEQQIFKSFFLNNPQWDEIRLDKIAQNYVSYQGFFLGKKNEILIDLKAVPKGSPFRILSSSWEKNHLTIKLTWVEVLSSLEKFKKTLNTNNFFETNTDNEDILEPTLQVPLRKFKQTFILPFNMNVFDNIRHRGDSTLFKIRLPKKNTHKRKNFFLKINWLRIGQTNLVPKISIFNKNKILKKSYNLGKKKNRTFIYKISNKEEILFLRISDNLGFLEDVAGSYQSFRYILSVNEKTTLN